jgi:hypothetical protein
MFSTSDGDPTNPSAVRGRRAKRPAFRGGSSMTSSAPRPATSSGPACREFVAMKLTGQKTVAVYRRYAIVSDASLRDAADNLAAIAAPGTGTVTKIRRA